MEFISRSPGFRNYHLQVSPQMRVKYKGLGFRFRGGLGD